MHIDAVRERFHHPPAEFGPTPFWFLNDQLAEEDLVRALEEMKDKGIAGVIMHPRTGMEVEYLSDLYWERLVLICQTLKRLGLQGWLYDEYNWPSGPAGGRVLREHPEFLQTGLTYGLSSSSRLAKKLQGLPGAILAGYDVQKDKVTDRTEDIKNGRFEKVSGQVLLFRVLRTLSPTHATCGAPWARGELGYLDVLNPEAVAEFMRLTHFEYDRRLRQYYGNPIVGIFTDEVGNYCALPYSNILPTEFQKRYEEELRSCLPPLAGRFSGIPVEKHILDRTRYFELARDLFVDGFFKKIAAWASERGLLFTGHLNEDDKIDRIPAVSVSFFGPLSQMHMPGIDILEDKHGFNKRQRLMKHPHFTSKAASSIAHHCGATRTLCEIWGGNGWASPPESLKAVLNWVQASGINFINPHAAFMSLRGLRKRDFPASHFPPQPWWRFYRNFSDYIARLSMLNSEGVHVADVLLAFPLKSIWAEFDLKSRRGGLANIIERVSEVLLRNQFDFDYLFDEFLETGDVSVGDSRISVGEESYAVLAVPLNMVIPAKLLELAESFAAAGGKIIAFGYSVPAHDEYGREISGRVEALFGEGGPPNAEYHRLTSEEEEDLNWLPRKLARWLPRDLVVEGELARNAAFLHRRIDGAHSYFLANLSEEESQLEFAFRSTGRPQFWNPEDGTVRDVLAYETDDHYTHITHTFDPNEAGFFVFTDQPEVHHVDATNLKLSSVTHEYADGYTGALEIRLTRNQKRYRRAVEQAYQPLALPRRWLIDYPLRNILLLDEWEVEILSNVSLPQWSPHQDPRLGLRPRLILEATRQALAIRDKLKKLRGKITRTTTKYERLSDSADTAERWCRILGIDPEDFEEAEGVLLKMAQYAGMPIGYDYPPPGSRYAMSAAFFLEYIPDDLAVVYEDEEEGPVSVQLNGHEVDKRPEPVFVWDRSNKAIPISTIVRKGRNHLRLERRQPTFPTLFPSVHGIEPVCLTGRFWVKKGKIVEQQYGSPAVPWADIGLPNYIGALTYKSSFKLPPKFIGQQLFLKFDRVNVSAEVKLNGKDAGVLLWRPYTLDVTHLLVQGENAIEVTVANTAANLLAQPVQSGLIGRVHIVPYWRHRIRF